jgi:hypothetical protein
MNIDRADAEAALQKLALKFEAAWRQMRGRSFAGTVIVETKNTTYRFVDGVFSARASLSPKAFPVWESPGFMDGVELLGFLTRKKGLWSLSPNWEEGSLAVITTQQRSLTLTSPTTHFDQHEATIPTIRTVIQAAPIRRSA